jgi:hypothetical protein
VDFDPSPYPYVITPSTFYPDVYLDYQLSVIGDPEVSIKACAYDQIRELTIVVAVVEIRRVER